jgi:hypothetical protein
MATGSVFAADPEVDAYVDRVEPICKSNSNANSRILKGLNKDINKERLKLAGRKVARAAAAFSRALKQIKRVQKPAEEVRTLKKWLGYLDTQYRFLIKVSKALKAENENLASTYNVKLNRNMTLANNTVVTFGFRYCRIKSAQSYS